MRAFVPRLLRRCRPQARRRFTGEFFRQVVESGFQADLFQAPPVELAAQILRPTAVRTFFEGREGCRP